MRLDTVVGEQATMFGRVDLGMRLDTVVCDLGRKTWE